MQQNQNLSVAIRKATSDEDMLFLWDMLYEAAAVNPVMRELGKEAALKLPEINKYLMEWGRKGDTAFIAYDQITNEYLGAAWYRLFSAEQPGYGYVSEEVPELAMAVISGRTGQGIGTMLLEELIRQTVNENYSALSLSVDKSNRAIKFYEQHGFVDAQISDEQSSSVTLKLQIRDHDSY